MSSLAESFSKIPFVGWEAPYARCAPWAPGAGHMTTHHYMSAPQLVAESGVRTPALCEEPGPCRRQSPAFGLQQWHGALDTWRGHVTRQWKNYLWVRKRQWGTRVCDYYYLEMNSLQSSSGYIKYFDSTFSCIDILKSILQKSRKSLKGKLSLDPLPCFTLSWLPC